MAAPASTFGAGVIVIVTAVLVAVVVVRQDSEDVIRQRLDAAREEMSHYGEFDYVIVNEDFETAVTEMCSIFTASRLRKDAQVARHSRLITSLLVDD